MMKSQRKLANISKSSPSSKVAVVGNTCNCHKNLHRCELLRQAQEKDGDSRHQTDRKATRTNRDHLTRPLSWFTLIKNHSSCTIIIYGWGNFDHSLVVTIAVTWYLWAPSTLTTLFTCGTTSRPPHSAFLWGIQVTISYKAEINQTEKQLRFHLSNRFVLQISKASNFLESHCQHSTSGPNRGSENNMFDLSKHVHSVKKAF